tara:strand:- start:2684 stop:3451 length:768 start_codon:yes stop_codon:yes gene_type:complete
MSILTRNISSSKGKAAGNADSFHKRVAVRLDNNLSQTLSLDNQELITDDDFLVAFWYRYYGSAVGVAPFKTTGALNGRGNASNGSFRFNWSTSGALDTTVNGMDGNWHFISINIDQDGDMTVRQDLDANEPTETIIVDISGIADQDLEGEDFIWGNTAADIDFNEIMVFRNWTSFSNSEAFGDAMHVVLLQTTLGRNTQGLLDNASLPDPDWYFRLNEGSSNVFNNTGIGAAPTMILNYSGGVPNLNNLWTEGNV